MAARRWTSPLLVFPFFAALGACADPPGEEAETVASDLASVDVDAPGPLRVETIVSANWEASTAGLVNLRHPAARAARIANEKVPIVLTVHVVHHPTRGVFVIDTGVPRRWVAGSSDNVSGLVAGAFVSGVAPAAPLADIVARSGQPLAGVFLTHMHIDHVLGLPDVPKGTPVFAGPEEREQHGLQHLLFQRAVDDLLEGHDVRTLALSRARPLESIRAAIDVFGDGSFFALHVPGHTDGSMAYLARTETGPVLFTGDCSHTRWGWENGVEPGIFTGDGPENARSLSALKRLAAAHPKMRVVVGHETDGVGTGIHPR